MALIKEAFEYANKKMREFNTGDFIRYSWVTDFEFGWEDEYIARIVKIEFGEVGFWGIKQDPHFVVERINDSIHIDLIKVSETNSAYYSPSVYPFAEYYVDTYGKNGREKIGHWGISRGVRIKKLDNVEIKNILINAKRLKEENIKRRKESERIKREQEEKKRQNEAISKEEIDALLKDYRDT